MIAPVLPDRAVLQTFIDALFRHADPDGFVIFKAYDGDDLPVFAAQGVRVGDTRLCDAAVHLAKRAATCGRPATFCPPVATFRDTFTQRGYWRALSQDVANGLAISVDADKAPVAARSMLGELLGAPTLESSSGGLWAEPETGELQERLHLHWRLKAPARTMAERQMLYEARKIATALVDADMTLVPCNHPLRWPGSVHNKAAPRLSRIVAMTDHEVDLASAHALLKAVWGDKPFGEQRKTNPGEPTAERDDVLSAVQRIPNDASVTWDAWKVKAMAIFAATGSHGFDIFDAWSAKCEEKYDPEVTQAAWDAIVRSPPTKLTAGSLFFAANQADPKWQKPSDEKRLAQRFEAIDATPSGTSAEKPRRRGENDPRPEIRIAAGAIKEAVDATESALIKRGGLYQRADRIVAIGETPVITAGGQEVRSARIFERGEHALAEDIAEAACIVKFNDRVKADVVVDPPGRLVKTLMQRVGSFRLPPLMGVILAPTLRADGTLLEEPGYDRATGLFFDTGEVTFPRIPREPSRQAAEQALQRLLDLLDGFPFEGDADRSVALSAIVTACVRQAMPTAPLHAFSAPVPSSGKSTLVDLASVIATGREAGVIAQAQDEAEMEKRLSSLFIAGASTIAIDNCSAPLDGDFLCAALTQPTVTIRPLGSSTTVTVPTNAFMTATGNGLVIGGDMVRRAILCQLDPRTERPELRRFSFSPIARAKAERVDLVAAALTILLAYRAAGSSDRTPPLGSFEAWSLLVRNALIWMGRADPVDTLERARSSDPKLGELAAVLAHWHGSIGPERATVRQVIERTARSDCADFREALLAVAGSGGVINGKRLGKWLGANAKRITHGQWVEPAGVLSGTQTWRLAGG